MLLSEILEEIAEKYPHSLTAASVVRKVNDVQNTIFREEMRRITQAAYNITAGTFLYKLPFPFSSLVDVVVGDVQYRYQDTQAQNTGQPFYYFSGPDAIGLYPTPTKDMPGGMTLFFYVYPPQLTAADQTVKPALDSTYHMLLVYGALVQIAENYADTAMVNNFAARYNGILEGFKRVDNETPEYPVVKDVMGGGWLY